MKKSIAKWKVLELRDKINQINFPEYQREPSIWYRRAKQRLIDSMVRRFDIASIYFYDNGDGTWDCVDGRQRIAAIMSFLDEDGNESDDSGFPFQIINEIYDDQSHEFVRLDGCTYTEIKGLAKQEDDVAVQFCNTIEKYKLNIVELSASSNPEEFNLQFTRLNLGTIINSGEKLHAMVGDLRDWCFNTLAKTDFLQSIDIPTRRYAREQLAAQIAAQIIAIENARVEGRSIELARVRHMDLQKLFKANTHLDIPMKGWLDRVQEVLKLLAEQSNQFPQMRSRSLVLSVVLLAYVRDVSSSEEASNLARFINVFYARLKEQVTKVSRGTGVEERYRYLLEFQKHLTQASVEKSAVQARAECLAESFDYWQDNDSQLQGDEE